MYDQSGLSTRDTMHGNPKSYQSGPLQLLLDKIKDNGGWGSVASVAGSVIPKKGFGNVASGALEGAGTGASIGSIVPGVGTAIGAAVGGIGGAIKGAFNWKDEQHQRQMQALSQIRGRMS